MKKLLILVFYLFPLLCFSKGGIHTIHTHPDLDDNNEVIINGSINYYHIPDQISETTGNALPMNTLYLNGSVEYSDSSGFDIGIQTQNLPILGGGAQNYERDTYVNLSQTFKLTHKFKVILGGQVGTVFNTSPRLHNADFILLNYQIFNNLNLHAGSIWVNKQLALTTDSILTTVGIAYTINPTWRIEADYYSGKTNLSGASISVFYNSIFFGILCPEHNSGNEFAGSVGFRFKFN